MTPVSVMPFSASSLPRDFSWLRSAPRPNADDVDAYTQVIAQAEGYAPDALPARLHDEAELQLWTWQAETRGGSTEPRAARRVRRNTAAAPAVEISGVERLPRYGAI